jgi:hypothetical protein
LEKYCDIKNELNNFILKIAGICGLYKAPAAKIVCLLDVKVSASGG